MSKMDRLSASEGLRKRTKSVPPIVILAHVLMSLLDYLASRDFASDDGELWNAMKADLEEVLRRG